MPKAWRCRLNYLMDKGGVVVNADGTFALNLPRMKKAVTGLTHDIMTLQAHGDYAGVQQLLKKMVEIRPAVKVVIDRLDRCARGYRAALRHGRGACRAHEHPAGTPRGAHHRLPHRKADHDAGSVSAVAQLAHAGLQPEEQPRSADERRRCGGAGDPRCAVEEAPGDGEIRLWQPRAEIPAPVLQHRVRHAEIHARRSSRCSAS